MDNLKLILQQFDGKYCIVSKGDISYIILANSYAPYELSESENSYIDAFYPASNALYHKGKAIEKVLESEGYSVINQYMNLKQLAVQGGLGARLNNQLVANVQYGTRMALHGIAIAGDYSHDINERPQVNCTKCNLCDIACPSGALNNGEFCREKCVREWQSAPLAHGTRGDGKILGCDICQRVCPHNSNLLTTDMHGKVLGKYSVQEFASMACGGRSQLAIIASYIGNNYARASYLKALINTACGTNECDKTH